MKNNPFYQEIISPEINKDTNQFIQNNSNEEISKEKINKPKELIEFNATFHFKENIINSDKNCKEQINENSYYCFSCKHSICSNCGINEHKNHLLIQRKNCLNYDTSFFNEISKLIEDSFLIEKKKDDIKKGVCNSIEKIKLNLDYLKEEKMNEIDKLFNQIYFSLNQLKKYYLNVRESIENYYMKNKVFFNIILNNEIGNKDLENTIFLMNFEIMNLCDNKNLDVLETINIIKYKINNYNTLVEKRTENKITEIKTFLDEDFNLEKFDDLYWDVKLRIKKYNEHIFQFKKIISEVYKKSGNLEKVNDMLDIFDSKNKKGKEVLFNQEYFMNNMTKDNIKYKKVRTNSKNKVHSPLRNNMSHSKSKNNIYNSNSLNKETLTSRSNINISPMNNSNLLNNNNVIHTINIPPDDIILDNRIIQKFFAYSIFGLYSKYFDNSDNTFNYENENNINYNNQNYLINNFNNNAINNNFQTFNINNNIINNINNNTPNNNNNNIYHRNANLLKKDFSKSLTNTSKISHINISSLLPNIKPNLSTLSYISSWTSRQNKLKEYAKPIPGTNYISLFDPINQKITEIQIYLIKEEHGYNIFPEGNRHILIDNILYITGGVDSVKNPINIVLSLNLSNLKIRKISNLNYPHSYHSIEYLDKYDCLILIGGEQNSFCEIFDIYSEKWIKLPELKIPRANINLYFDNFTSDIYALFGMEGKISEIKNNNSEAIEVLELKDIKSGWIKVDYYKSADLNLKINYISVCPFTKNKLLLYGGNKGRVEKKLFAIFDMIKNECVKVDNKIMEDIKLEEKKIQLVDFAIKKIK